MWFSEDRRNSNVESQRSKIENQIIDVAGRKSKAEGPWSRATLGFDVGSMHKFSFRTTATAWCLFALVWLAPGYAQETRLEWKFAQGDAFEVKLVQSSAMETTVESRTINQTSEMTVVVSWAVNSVDDQGAAKITQTIKSVQVNLKMPGKEGQDTYEYDSLSKTRPAGESMRLKESFDPIIGQPVILSVTRRGEISDVELPKETLESIRSMPGSMQGREALSLESIQKMFSQATVVFPDKPLNKGDQWTTQRKFEFAPQTFQQTTKFEFQGQTSASDATPDETTEEITFNATLKPQPNEKADPQQQLKILEQSTQGKIRFDGDAGNMKSSESDTELVTSVQYREMQLVTKTTSRLQVTMSRVD